MVEKLRLGCALRRRRGRNLRGSVRRGRARRAPRRRPGRGQRDHLDQRLTRRQRGEPGDVHGDDRRPCRRSTSTSTYTATSGGVSGSFTLPADQSSTTFDVATTDNGFPDASPRTFTVTLTGDRPDRRLDRRLDAGDRHARQHRPAVVGRLDRQRERRRHRRQPRDLPGVDLAGRRGRRSTSRTRRATAVSAARST